MVIKIAQQYCMRALEKDVKGIKVIKALYMYITSRIF